MSVVYIYIYCNVYITMAVRTTPSSDPEVDDAFAEAEELFKEKERREAAAEAKDRIHVAMHVYT